jgi:hypothetical protein
VPLDDPTRWPSRVTAMNTLPAPRARHPPRQRYTSTGILVCVSTLFVSLPITRAAIPRRPWEAMKITSQPGSVAVLIISSHGWSPILWTAP